MWDLISTEDNIINAIDHIRRNKRMRVHSEILFNTVNEMADEDNGKLNLTLFNDAMLNLEENGRIYNGGKDGKESYYIKEIGTNETEKQIDVLSESEEFDIIDNKFEHIKSMHQNTN